MLWVPLAAVVSEEYQKLKSAGTRRTTGSSGGAHRPKTHACSFRVLEGPWVVLCAFCSDRSLPGTSQAQGFALQSCCSLFTLRKFASIFESSALLPRLEASFNFSRTTAEFLSLIELAHRSSATLHEMQTLRRESLVGEMQECSEFVRSAGHRKVHLRTRTHLSSDSEPPGCCAWKLCAAWRQVLRGNSSLWAIMGLKVLSLASWWGTCVRSWHCLWATRSKVHVASLLR